MFRHFTIEELIHSDKARELGIDNTPDKDSIDRLTTLIIEVLDPARELLGKPIVVTSGYRCSVLNTAVGGQPNSQHTKGEAADLQCYNNKYLFDIIRENLSFDQLILETKDIFDRNGNKTGVREWVHISYKKGKNRKQVLRMHNGKTIR